MISKKLFVSASILILVALLNSIVVDSSRAQTGASLTFSQTSITTHPNQQVIVDINLNTAGQATLGTDLHISYDPTKVRIDELIPGNLYQDYPAIVIDSDLGLVSTSGIAGTGSNLYNGTGVFATLKLTPRIPGTITLSINHTPSNTRDSNIVVGDQDVLQTVNQLNLTVSSQANASTSQNSTGTTDNPNVTQTHQSSTSNSAQTGQDNQGTKNLTSRLASTLLRFFGIDNNPQAEETFTYPSNPLMPLQNTQPIIRTSQAQPTIALNPAAKLGDQSSWLPKIMPVLLATVMLLIVIFGAKIIATRKSQSEPPINIQQPTSSPTSTPTSITMPQPSTPNPPPTPNPPTQTPPTPPNTMI